MAEHSENLISAYLDNQLSAEERARFEEQLRQDSQLRELTDQLRAQSVQLAALPRYSLEPDFADRLVQDDRAVNFFQAARQGSQVRVNAKSQQLPVRTTRWQYAVGTVLAIAALIAIAAFLWIPEQVNNSPLAGKTGGEPTSETAVADEEEPFSTDLDQDIAGKTDSNRANAKAAVVPESGAIPPPAQMAETGKMPGRDDVLMDAIQAKESQQPATENPAFAPQGQVVESKGASNGGRMSRQQLKSEAASQDDEAISNLIVADSPSNNQLAQDAMDDQSRAEVDDSVQLEENESAEQQDSMEEEDAFSSAIASAEESDVIKVLFSQPTQTMDVFWQSLERSRIPLLDANSLAKSKSPGRAGGGGGAKQSKKDQISPVWGQQRAYLVEATDKQIADLIVDLEKQANISRLKKGEIPALQRQLANEAGQRARRADNYLPRPAPTDAMKYFADSEQRANAREIDYAEVMENLAGAGQNQNLKQLKTLDSLNARDKSLEVLRKHLLLLEFDAEFEGDADASNSIPANPSDK